MPTSTWAYSTGAGGCAAGRPAVNGQHLATADDTREIQTGSLADFGVSFSVRSFPTLPTDHLELEVDDEYSLTITSESANLKGILIRVEIEKAPSDEFGFGDDVFSFELLPTDTDLLQDADICESSTSRGLTHIDATPKQEVTGTIFFVDEAPTLWVDVTVVFNNALDEPSQYAYDRFEFSIVSSFSPSSEKNLATVESRTDPEVIPMDSKESSSPTYSYEQCYICGSPKGQVTLIDNVIMLSGSDGEIFLSESVCGNLEGLGRRGQIPPKSCEAIIETAASICGCTEQSTLPTTMPNIIPKPSTSVASTLPPTKALSGDSAGDAPSITESMPLSSTSDAPSSITSTTLSTTSDVPTKFITKWPSITSDIPTKIITTLPSTASDVPTTTITTLPSSNAPKKSKNHLRK